MAGRDLRLFIGPMEDQPVAVTKLKTKQYFIDLSDTKFLNFGVKSLFWAYNIVVNVFSSEAAAAVRVAQLQLSEACSLRVKTEKIKTTVRLVRYSTYKNSAKIQKLCVWELDKILCDL